VMSLLPDLSELGNQIQVFVFENFVPRSSAIVQERLREFSDQARNLTFVGIVILGVTAFMMLVTIERAFNLIWQVPQERHGLQRFLTYWAVLTFGPPLIGVGLAVSTYLFSLPLVADIDTLGVRQTLLVYLPAILSTAAFTLIFGLVPNCHVPFIHALIGGALTTLGLEACKALFAFTVANSNMTLIYGTFAAVPLFLSWLYLVWALILFGAIVVRTLALKPEPARRANEPPLVGALRVLSELRRAHAQGLSVTDQDLAQRVPLNTEDRKKVFDALHDLKLILRTEAEELALGRSLDSVNLWSLYERLPEGVAAVRNTLQGLPGLSKRLDQFVIESEERLGVTLEELLKESD
jgi:membrane protein